MAAIYRLPKEGEKAESWEGYKFVSTIAEGAELDAMLKSGWVDHPAKLTEAVTERKVRRNAVDKA